MPTRWHIRVLKTLLFFLAFVLIFTWLPIVRGILDGPSYQWGTSYFDHFFSGKGLGADSWLLFLKLGFGGAILWLGYRGPRRPFHWLVLAWLAVGAADILHGVVTNPEGMVFRGDTLGIELNVGYAAAAVYLGMLALGLFWVARDLKLGPAWPKAAWTRRNKALAVTAVAALPVQFVLLRFGEPHGLSDQIGVILTMAQWAVINAALYPWGAWKRKP